MEMQAVSGENGWKSDIDAENPLLNINTKRSQDEPTPERGSWANRFEFLLAIVGYTVGIGSIWRFPILCARNGTGAFLIPFFIFMALCGFPLYYIEVSLGQFCGLSAGKAFDFCPLLKGLVLMKPLSNAGSFGFGFAFMYLKWLPKVKTKISASHHSGIGYLMVLISFNILWYYVSIMGWILYYFVNSFSRTLPWTTCDNWWNTPQCKVLNSTLLNDTMDTNMTSQLYVTSLNGTALPPNATLTYTSPATEFWLLNVLRVSGSLENMGAIQWHLVLSNFAGWTLVVAALIKGVQSLGKVVYITATAPYVLLTVLLIRGLTLDGAIDGILWYIIPDFSRLADPQVWLEAAIQVFYSLGPTYGGVITMASHNKFHQKSIVETTVCVISDAFTAFYAGLVVFTCLGFMAKEAGVSVEEVAKASGPGLAFVAYPEALAKMPLPQLWAVLFFLTLITVAFDSTFGMFETVTGTIIDMFPRLAVRNKWFKYAVLVGTALLLFVLSTPLSMAGGIYLFQLSDWYISAFALLFGSSLECIMVCWIYGADRFAKDIELMTGRRSSKLLRIFWCIVMTGCLTGAFFLTLFTYSEPEFSYGYRYKPYAIKVGLGMAFVPFVPIIVLMVKEILQAKGPLLKRIPKLLRPSKSWQPVDPQAREIYRSKPYRYEDTVWKRIKMDVLGDKDTPWI